jgi:hypothetical protein
MPQAATQTDPIILAILSTMPQAATQVLQHADASLDADLTSSTEEFFYTPRNGDQMEQNDSSTTH